MVNQKEEKCYFADGFILGVLIYRAVLVWDDRHVARIDRGHGDTVLDGYSNVKKQKPTQRLGNRMYCVFTYSELHDSTDGRQAIFLVQKIQVVPWNGLSLFLK